MTFVDAAGKTIGAIPIYDLTANQARDVELPRGALATLLCALTRNSAVRYRFDDSIEAIEDDGARVDVRFRSGERRHYDIVVGADGMHSNVRRLVFGPEAPFNRYLGYTFNLFSMPNDWGLSHGAIVYAEAGRAAGAFAVRDSPKVFSFLIFATERPPFSVNPSVAEQIERTAAVFADRGWEVPRLLEAMRHADVIDVTYVPDRITHPDAVRFPPIDEAVFEAGERVAHEDAEGLTRRVYQRRSR